MSDILGKPIYANACIEFHFHIALEFFTFLWPQNVSMQFTFIRLKRRKKGVRAAPNCVSETLQGMKFQNQNEQRTGFFSTKNYSIQFQCAISPKLIFHITDLHVIKCISLFTYLLLLLVVTTFSSCFCHYLYIFRRKVTLITAHVIFMFVRIDVSSTHTPYT